MRQPASVLRGLGALGTAILLLTASASASDTPSKRGSLKGLDAIGVVIETVDSDAEKDGLTKGQLQTEVESRLRQAGHSVSRRRRYPTSHCRRPP